MTDAMTSATIDPAARAEGRVNLELRFAGMDEARAADAIASATRGVARRAHGRAWVVDTAKFGAFHLSPNSRARGQLFETGKTAQSGFKPVELLTEPFPVADLVEFRRVTDALRNAGASGAQGGQSLGFRTHIHIEGDMSDIVGVVSRLAAYALIEQGLRPDRPVDLSRQMLPFVPPYPDALVDALAQSLPETADDLLDLYLAHVTHPIHGLDLLPLLATHDADRVRSAIGEVPETTPRAAFHFRLSDCRIDETDWNVDAAWHDWSLVEAVADDPVLLSHLRAARRDWSRESAWGRMPWFKVVEGILSDSGGDTA